MGSVQGASPLFPLQINYSPVPGSSQVRRTHLRICIAPENYRPYLVSQADRIADKQRDTLNHLATTPTTFQSGIATVNNTISSWKLRWTTPIKSTSFTCIDLLVQRVDKSGTHEYDIIALFSAFVLALTLVKKSDHPQSQGETGQAKMICENMAFEVCCASIQHYKTWTGILNSATFEYVSRRCQF